MQSTRTHERKCQECSSSNKSRKADEPKYSLSLAVLHLLHSISEPELGDNNVADIDIMWHFVDIRIIIV